MTKILKCVSKAQKRAVVRALSAKSRKQFHAHIYSRSDHQTTHFLPEEARIWDLGQTHQTFDSLSDPDRSVA